MSPNVGRAGRRGRREARYEFLVCGISRASIRVDAGFVSGFV